MRKCLQKYFLHSFTSLWFNFKSFTEQILVICNSCLSKFKRQIANCRKFLTRHHEHGDAESRPCAPGLRRELHHEETWKISLIFDVLERCSVSEWNEETHSGCWVYKRLIKQTQTLINHAKVSWLIRSSTLEKQVWLRITQKTEAKAGYCSNVCKLDSWPSALSFVWSPIYKLCWRFNLHTLTSITFI